MPKMRSNDVLADHRAGKAGFRFADFRMPEMLRHRNLRGVDISRNKCLYRASLAGAQAASALPARYTPLSTFRLGKGKEAQRAVYDSNDDIAKNLGREERKPDNLHCQREGVVEQPHQDRKNETQDFVCGERDKNKWDDNHIVEGTAEAAFLGPCRVMIIGHGATVPG